MLVVQIGFPLLDGLTSLLLTMMETAKGYFGMKVAKYNKEMHKACAPEETITNKIGFIYEEEEIDDEEIL